MHVMDVMWTCTRRSMHAGATSPPVRCLGACCWVLSGLQQQAGTQQVQNFEHVVRDMGQPRPSTLVTARRSISGAAIPIAVGISTHLCRERGSVWLQS